MKRATIIIALAAAPLLADEIMLRGGGRLTGEIVEKTEDSITIDIGAGPVTVRMSTVVAVEEGPSALQEYRDRAAAIAAEDVGAWRELGQWAAGQGLGVQSREAYERVHAILPDDPEANQALGLVRYEGRWITEDESYLARGFVEFEGAWMMPAERQAILDERRAREDANRQAAVAEAERSQAQLEERAAREAEEEKAESVQFLNDSLPKLGDAPVYWPYGYGPTSWPTPTSQQSKEPK